jgi:hypothetical protein
LERKLRRALIGLGLALLLGGCAAYDDGYYDRYPGPYYSTDTYSYSYGYDWPSHYGGPYYGYRGYYGDRFVHDRDRDRYRDGFHDRFRDRDHGRFHDHGGDRGHPASHPSQSGGRGGESGSFYQRLLERAR